MHFNLDTPYFLLLLLLLPCFVWCKVFSKKYYFPKISWLKKEGALLVFENWLKILLFSLMVFALSKPYTYDDSSHRYKKGRNLVLALDASGSMGQNGFDPQERYKSKYASTIEISKHFIEQRHDDNMGVVIFGSFAYTASPLTYDLHALNALLEMTTVGIAGDSTAIGDALIQAIDTLSFDNVESKAIILITDGHHNSGRYSPKHAVEKAKKEKVKIYTIGIGEKSDYDADLLEHISSLSGGKSYQALTSHALADVYKEIDKLEPSKIRGEEYLHKNFIIFPILIIVFILLFLWTLHESRREI